MEISQDLVCDAHGDAAATAVCSEFYSVDMGNILNTGRIYGVYAAFIIHFTVVLGAASQGLSTL